MSNNHISVVHYTLKPIFSYLTKSQIAHTVKKNIYILQNKYSFFISFSTKIRMIITRTF